MSKLIGQIGIMFSMGGTKNEFGLRKELMTAGGYMDFFRNRLLPLYKRGFRLFSLHRPFGEYVQGDQFMDQSSAHYLAYSQYDFIIDDWHAAMKWATTWMPDAEFIVYTGTHGFDMQRDLQNNDIHEHLTKLYDGVAHFLPYKNVHIAYDQMTTLNNDHPMAMFVQLINTYMTTAGRTVFIEPSPVLNDPTKSWLVNIPSICSAGFTATRAKRSERRQPGNGVVHADFMNAGDRNWETIGIPDFWVWMKEMSLRPDSVTLIWENMISHLGDLSITQIVKKIDATALPLTTSV